MSSKDTNIKKSVSFQRKPDEVKDLHAKVGHVTQESVSSTRRMVKLVDECQDAGINTLMNLNTQGESLNRTEAALDNVHHNLKEADETLTTINRTEKVPLIFLPCYLCCCKKKTKSSRASTVKAKTENRIVPKMKPNNPRETKSQTIQGKMSKVSSLRTAGEGDEKDSASLAASNNSRSRPRVPVERFFSKITGTKEEDEIEDNLSHVSSHLTKLKSQALVMGSTVEIQNAQIDRMNTRTSIQRSRIAAMNMKTAKLLNGHGSSSITNTATSCPCPCSGLF